MLKKFFLSVALCAGICGSCLALDNKEVDDLGYEALANAVLDSDLTAAWYLYHSNPEKYDRLKNDEFEWGDAVKEAKENFAKISEQYKNYSKDKTFVELLSAEFGEYNFEKEAFPIERFLSSNSYVNISSTNVCCSKLVFDNINQEKHFIKMPKEEAKNFLKTKKSSSGYVNRDIGVDVEFSVTKSELSENLNYPTSRAVIKVTGHVKKLIVRDRDGKILSTIDYE
ncbi:MAG: DUF4852 domain-containing protein [Campylobacter sp.]|nr:DUF4852 domain-containing protein [Campylobacter sp.]